jgi:hypothetical protein
MNKPLTLEQAEKICRNYQFLEGMPYDKEFSNTTPVLSVMVAPYKEQAQQELIDDYDMLGYTDLKLFDPKEGYDVIVVARYQPDEEICLWMDIRSFVKRNIMQVAQYHKAQIIAADRNEIAA